MDLIKIGNLKTHFFDQYNIRVIRCDYFQRTVRFFHQLSVVRFRIDFVRFFLKQFIIFYPYKLTLIRRFIISY